MTDLHRSRALVRLDQNGFLLPIEPVTPPNSTAWRVVHFSPTLIALGLGLFVIAAAATPLAAMALVAAGLTGRAALYVPAIVGTLVVVASYFALVRFAERRRTVEELSLGGSAVEIVLGGLGGVAIVAVTLALICLLGAGSVLGVQWTGGLIAPTIFAACAAIVQEFIVRGEVFRLIERLAGSWIALGLTVAGLVVIHLGNETATLYSALGVAVVNGLLFTGTFMLTRRLWAPLALHVAWNVGQLLFGVAGGSPPLPGLVQSVLHGSDELTGGASGIGGSIPGIAVAALASAVLFVAAIRRSRIVAPAWTRGTLRVSRRSVAAQG